MTSNPLQFTALGNPLAQDLTHALRKGLAHIATIAKHALCPLQPCLSALKSCNVPLHIHRNVTLDARDTLLASSPFRPAVSVFLTLCESTIKSVLEELRPCFLRAALI